MAESASRRSKCSHKFKPKPDGSAALAIGCRSGDVTTPDVAPASRSLAPEAGPHRLEGEAALLGVAVATRARSFPGALAEVGGARAEVQVGSSHLGSLVWSQTLGVVLSGLG